SIFQQVEPIDVGMPAQRGAVSLLREEENPASGSRPAQEDRYVRGEEDVPQRGEAHDQRRSARHASAGPSRDVGLREAELKAVELLVEAGRLNQLRVRSGLDDPTL